MVAVVGEAIFAAGTVAESLEVLTKTVVSELPFHCTVEPETNPVPVTTRLRSGPPGATAAGPNGFRNGTGVGVTGTACIGTITANNRIAAYPHTLTESLRD